MTSEDSALGYLRRVHWDLRNTDSCTQTEQLFQASAVQLQTLSELRINLVLALQSATTDVVGQRSIDILTRHVRLFGKLFRQMQQKHASRFVSLPLCGDLVLYYWSKVVQASSAPQEYITGISSYFVSR